MILIIIIILSNVYLTLSFLTKFNSNSFQFSLRSKGFGSSNSKSNNNINKVRRKTIENEPIKINDKVNKIEILSSHDIIKYLANHCPTINASFPQLRLISIDPPVLEIDNFLTHQQCDDYISLALDKGYTIQESQTFGNVLGSGIAGSVRTSTTWYMTYESMKTFITNIYNVLQLPVLHYEEPQIVRYQMGQQFSWHYDTLPKTIIDSSGQRLVTVIAYLNDMPVSAGGATVFKDLNLQVRPVKGKALIFFPSYSNGTIDDRTMHAGQIAMDTKWIAQLWIHQNNYNPALPPGNVHINI